MAKEAGKIRFHFLTERFTFTGRSQLKEFLIERITQSGRSAETINFIFVTDEYLLEVNKKYLNHDTLTDIITFDLSEEKLKIIADIYISVDRVKENSVLLNVPFKNELHRVIFHGVLHLLGFKDKKTAEAANMRSMEDKWLADYFSTWNTLH